MIKRFEMAIGHFSLTRCVSAVFALLCNIPSMRLDDIERVATLRSLTNDIRTRKCLILFNWLGPLTSIQAQHEAEDNFTGKRSSKSAQKAKPLLHTFLHASPPTLLELANGLSDDIATFSRIGLIGKRTGERAAYYADWCWFLSTLVNIVENAVERNVLLEQQQQGTYKYETHITVPVLSRLSTSSRIAALQRLDAGRYCQVEPYSEQAR